MAAREKLRRDITSRQGETVTLISEIGTGHSKDAFIDEAAVDNVQQCLVAEMAQSGLVVSLALGRSASLPI